MYFRILCDHGEHYLRIASAGGRSLTDAEISTPHHDNKPKNIARPKENYLQKFKEQELHQSLAERATGFLGLLLILGVSYVMSTNRRAISWRVVFYGIGLQFLLAVIVLKTHVGRLIFDGANNVVVKILSFSVEGSRFVFGNLVALNVPVGIPAAADSAAHMADLSLTGAFANTGAYFAFAVLPTIIFFSALTAILYYFGILQFIVRGISRCMQFTLGTSGAESFSAAANIFLGQTEAPLLVKPFLKDMTKSEIMAVMSGGFATVSGGVLSGFCRHACCKIFQISQDAHSQQASRMKAHRHH